MAVTAVPPTQSPSTPNTVTRPQGALIAVLARLQETKDLLGAITAIAAALATVVGLFAPDPNWSRPIVAIIIIGALLVFAFVTLRQKPQGETPPIRGLLPYDEDDPLPVRAREREDLRSLLTNTSCRLFVLSGPSGSGKTSLIRAGVLPRAGSQDVYPVFVSRSGTDPRASILQEIPAAGDRSPLMFVDRLVAAASEIHASSAKDLVVICDQFDAFLAEAARDDQTDFFRDVWLAINLSARVRFLFVVSDAFLDTFQQVVNDAVLTSASIDLIAEPYKLSFLTRAEARTVVDQWISGGELPIRRGFISAIIRPLIERGAVSPSLLQLVAQSLQQTPVADPAQLAVTGGIDGIVTAHVLKTAQNTPNPEYTISVLARLLPPTATDQLPILSTDQLIANGQECRRRSAGSDVSKEACQRAFTETITVLRRARVIVGRGPGEYSLAGQLIERAARSVVNDWQRVAEPQSAGEHLLRSYVSRFGFDPSISINQADLRVIERTACLSSRASEPARTLLIQSTQELGKRGHKRRALAVAAAACLVPLAVIVVADAYATPQFQKVTDFELRDPRSGRDVLATSIAVEPKRGIVAMTHRDSSLGLYFWSLEQGAASGNEQDSPSSRTAKVIPGTVDLKYTALAFNPSGNSFLSGRADGAVQFWSSDGLDVPSTYTLPRASEATRFPNVTPSAICTDTAINGLDFDQSGEHLLISTSCGRLELWSMQGDPTLEAVADLKRVLIPDGASLSPNGRLMAVRCPPFEDRPGGLFLFRREGQTLRELANQSFDDMSVLSVEFRGNNRLVALAVNEAGLEKPEVGVQLLHIDLDGGRSAEKLTTALVEQPLAVLSYGAETMAVNVGGDGSVPWGIWKGDRRSADIVLRADQGTQSRGALTADGRQLVLSQTYLNSVYEWGTWFAGFRLPWRG